MISTSLSRLFKLTLSFAHSSHLSATRLTAEQSGNVIDALAKAGKSPGDNLWEANWDDDDIEDDFTKQLRWVSDLLVNHVFSIEAA